MINQKILLILNRLGSDPSTMFDMEHSTLSPAACPEPDPLLVNTLPDLNIFEMFQYFWLQSPGTPNIFWRQHAFFFKRRKLHLQVGVPFDTGLTSIFKKQQ